MAVISRGGVYLEPTLFISDSNNVKYNPFPLGISQMTLDTVYDGMRAVVNESEGTAYNAFSHHGFSSQGITVYGKTGSTEKPEHAWFAGFTKESSGRSIAIALVVEGGESGGNVAAPIAAEILNLCVESGCIGRNSR
jgi:cell division protein FtsI/penicillin-binding protein 2